MDHLSMRVSLIFLRVLSNDERPSLWTLIRKI